MAKVRVADGCVDIQVSLLERIMLAERSRRVPLSSIRAVDPHPSLPAMKMHWAAQGGVWLCGVSAYDGHLIPSARNPARTLALEVGGAENGAEGDRYLYVEVDDQAPERVAEQIEHAVRGSALQPTTLMRPPPPLLSQNEQEEVTMDSSPSDKRIARWDEDEEAEEQDWEDDEENIRLRDPLMQGSLAPPPGPSSSLRPPRAPRFANDRDLGRLGAWLVTLGSVSTLVGTSVVAAGLLPGLIAVGAGIACGIIGGLALATHHHHG